VTWPRGTHFVAAALAAVFAIALFSSTAFATFPGANGLIAFQGARGNQYSTHVFINTIRPDGTDIQPLAQGYDPSWSPDGRHLLFERYVGPSSVPGAPKYAIFTMHADGSDLHRVGYSPFIESGATYTPGGHRILFTRTTQLVDVYDEFAIATMRLDGSDERILAKGQFGAFGYSPSGGRILFGNGADIWDMRPNGSHRRHLSSGSEADYSPDGKHISLFYNDEPYVMRSDGSHLHPLGDCSQGPAIYSPDDRRLAWQGHIGPPRSAVGDIFTSNLRCTDSFRVTYQANDGGAYYPSWQPLP
jgi:Tol biopolymer transport system component